MLCKSIQNYFSRLILFGFFNVSSISEFVHLKKKNLLCRIVGTLLFFVILLINS